MFSLLCVYKSKMPIEWWKIIIYLSLLRIVHINSSPNSIRDDGLTTIVVKTTTTTVRKWRFTTPWIILILLVYYIYFFIIYLQDFLLPSLQCSPHTRIIIIIIASSNNIRSHDNNVPSGYSRAFTFCFFSLDNNYQLSPWRVCGYTNFYLYYFFFHVAV